MVPMAGPRASTDDSINEFQVPEIKKLICDMRSEGVEFRSLDEIESILLPKLDVLHYAHMQKVMATLVEKGIDTSRY